MTFKDILAQVIDWLEQDKRITYRALKRQFDLDDAYLEDLKAELIQAKRLAVDEDDAVLVWRADTPAVPESPPALSPPTPSPAASAIAYAHEPLSYTPAHLAEKILTSRSALEGERKQVTALFCDLANSTAMAEQIGPEPMHTLLNRFFTLALQDVHRFEGTINQFLGDGFMALFGAPLAHGNRSAIENLTLAITSCDDVPCRHGNPSCLTLRHLGPDTP